MIEIQTIYEVFDRYTGEVVDISENKDEARDVRDQLDVAYGAIRFSVREGA